MSTLWRQLDAFLATGTTACLVTILTVRGSSPREAGTHMAIRHDGSFSGTIGGGALEWQALALAQTYMREFSEGGANENALSLGPSLGQCCGGHVTLRFEVLSQADRDWVAPLAQVETERTKTGHSLFTLGIPDARGIIKRVALAQSTAPSDAILETFGQAHTPLALFGAGHIGRALILALAPLPFHIRWIDQRRAEFPAVFPPNVTAVAAADPVAELGTLPSDACVLAVTHSHALDLAIMDAALRQNIAFTGVIGSDTKRARFIAQLRQMGHLDETLARLICPVGMPLIRAKEPAIIAAGIVVQLLDMRQNALSVEPHEHTGTPAHPIALVPDERTS